MRTIKRVLLFAFFLHFSSFFAANFEIRSSYKSDKKQNSSYFFSVDDKKQTDQFPLEFIFKWQKGGFAVNSSLFSTLIAGDENKTHLYLNELFYDTSVKNWEVSLGKKLLGYGVGYGFRPTDIIQKQTRRTFLPTQSQGIPSLIIEKFTLTGTLSFVYAIEGSWELEKVDIERHNFAVRPYILLGNWDVMGIVHADDGGEFNIGSALNRVFGESWKLHTELLYKTQYHYWENHLKENENYAGDPMYEKKKKSGALQSVFGLYYSGKSKIGLLTEYWYDGTAYSADDWDRHIEIAKEQNKLLENPFLPDDARGQIQDRIKSLSKAYLPTNLLTHNIFLRLEYSADKFDPTFDWLFTPQDFGSVFTFQIESEISGRQKLNLGYRFFDGPADSAFGASPMDWSLFATWTLAWSL